MNTKDIKPIEFEDQREYEKVLAQIRLNNELTKQLTPEMLDSWDPGDSEQPEDFEHQHILTYKEEFRLRNQELFKDMGLIEFEEG